MTTASPQIKPNPELDLVLERVIDVPRDLVWSAWTEPKHLKHWFVPKPWTLVECEIDLRPGGIFRSVMRSPEGEEFPNDGCILEVRPKERFIWTDTLLPGYRPAPEPFFTAVIDLEALGDNSTRYVATAIHGNVESRRKHEEMGFHEGWGTTLDQLVAHIKEL